MSPLSEQILQSLTILPEEDQRQILDFVEFIKAKRQRTAQTQSEDTPRSFLETAQAIIGMGEGPGDLSTNPAYMEGYGE